MPTIKPNPKDPTKRAELTSADIKAYTVVAASLDFLFEFDKCAAAKDGAINIRAVLKHYEKPSKTPKTPEAPAAK